MVWRVVLPLLIVLVAFGAAEVQAQRLYRWVDEKGVTHISELPSKAEADKKKTPKKSAAAKKHTSIAEANPANRYDVHTGKPLPGGSPKAATTSPDAGRGAKEALAVLEQMLVRQKQLVSRDSAAVVQVQAASPPPAHQQLSENGGRKESATPGQPLAGKQIALAKPVTEPKAAPAPPVRYELVAVSRDWLISPGQIPETTLSIRPVKNNTYGMKLPPGPAIDAGQSLYMMCVIHHFAASRGFSDWKEAVERPAGETGELFFTLVAGNPVKSASIRETCSGIIRPEYLWGDTGRKQAHARPVCGKFVWNTLTGEQETRPKNPKPGASKTYEYRVDIDGDGRADTVTETVSGEKSRLSVQCSGGKRYSLSESGSMFLLSLEGREHVMVRYMTWDAERKNGKVTGLRLYELKGDRAKLVCDRADLKDLL